MRSTDICGLQRLIDACTDDGCTLRRESRFVGELARPVLLAAAQERSRFADALATAAGRDRAPTRGGGSWSELLRELVRSAEVAAGGPNRGDAIRACRRSSARTEARYDRALARSWPEEIGPMLLEQLTRIRRAGSELTELQF